MKRGERERDEARLAVSCGLVYFLSAAADESKNSLWGVWKLRRAARPRPERRFFFFFSHFASCGKRGGERCDVPRVQDQTLTLALPERGAAPALKTGQRAQIHSALGGKKKNPSNAVRARAGLARGAARWCMMQRRSTGLLNMRGEEQEGVGEEEGEGRGGVQGRRERTGRERKGEGKKGKRLRSLRCLRS